MFFVHISFVYNQTQVQHVACKEHVEKMNSPKAESTHWERISEPAFYRYRGFTSGPVTAPVLMVDQSPQSPELWDVLGVYFMTDGFQHIYASQLPTESPLMALMRAVEQVLDETRAEWLLLLAHGKSAAPALHFIETQQGYKKVKALIGLNGEYQHNTLSYLEGKVLEHYQMTEHDVPPANLELADQFVMLNVHGQAPTSYLKPDRVILPLPEAVNVGVNLHPKDLLQAPRLYNDILRPYLSGTVWIVQLHLVGFQMQPGAPEAPIGKFFFEIEQQRVPPEGLFAPPDNDEYNFEDNYTPLGTIAYPAKPEIQAANITLRLREADRSVSKRRRALRTNLHVPLKEGKIIDHIMQDSFGSEIRLRISCMRTPVIIPPEK